MSRKTNAPIAAAAAGVLVLGGGAGIAVGQVCEFEILSNPRLGESSGSRLDGVDREGNLLYATITGDKDLRIFDVSVPESPQLLSLSTFASATGVAVADSLVVLCAPGSVATVDATDPAAPRLLDTIATPGEGWSVTIRGSVAFIAGGEGGVAAVDISDPDELRPLDVFDTPGRAYQTAEADDIMYVADWDGGVRILDVRDPTGITQINSLTGWNVYDVALEGSILAVATSRDRVIFFDVSDPAAPVELGSVDTGQSALAVALIDSVAWIAAGGLLGDAHLLGVDARDPAAPIEFGRVRFPPIFQGSHATAFTVSEHILHVPVFLYEQFSPLEVDLYAVDVSPCSPCYADCDASGSLDFFDFLCFQNLFAAGDPGADCDGSGELDLFDFLCFQNQFAEGCP